MISLCEYSLVWIFLSTRSSHLDFSVRSFGALFFGMNLQLRLYLVYLTFSILYERRGDRGSYWIHARLFTRFHSVNILCSVSLLFGLAALSRRLVSLFFRHALVLAVVLHRDALLLVWF